MPNYLRFPFRRTWTYLVQFVRTLTVAASASSNSKKMPLTLEARSIIKCDRILQKIPLWHKVHMRRNCIPVKSAPAWSKETWEMIVEFDEMVSSFIRMISSIRRFQTTPSFTTVCILSETHRPASCWPDVTTSVIGKLCTGFIDISWRLFWWMTKRLIGGVIIKTFGLNQAIV